MSAALAAGAAPEGDPSGSRSFQNFFIGSSLLVAVVQGRSPLVRLVPEHPSEALATDPCLLEVVGPPCLAEPQERSAREETEVSIQRVVGRHPALSG